MRHLLIGVMIFALGAGCTKRGATPAQPPTTASEESEPADFRTPEEPKPPAIVKLADAFLASLPPEQRPKNPEWARDDFVRCFFMGFTNHTGSMSGGEVAGLQGFKAGQEFRRANPDKLKETFESFGYVAAEVEGTWTTGFEHSGFKPHRERSTEEWWLSGFSDTVSDLPKGEKIPDEGVGIRIIGFLSPRGSYGHLGSYDHEFYATKISKANGAPAASAPRPVGRLALASATHATMTTVRVLICSSNNASSVR